MSSSTFSPIRFAVVALFALTGVSHGADYRVAPLNEGPPKDELSEAVAGTLHDSGLRVIRGSDRTVCDIWLRKEWPLPDQAAVGRLYPFQPGQLIGAIRYPRDGADFRDQDIESGVYTLRYGLQPIDGNHIGTSPTRDFLLLVIAEQDKSVDPLSMDALNPKSAEAAQTQHPAILSLQKRPDRPDEYPAMTHDENHDWWIVQFQGEVSKAGKTEKQPVDLVIVGAAAE